MAIFDTNKRLTCKHCGNTTFVEQVLFMYDKTPDNKIKRTEVPGLPLKTCAKCSKIYWDTDNFFEGATIV